MDWQITSGCNRKCQYCYGPQIEYEISTKEAFKIVDIFEEIGVKVVGITGGEPLLRTDIIDIIKYIKSKNMAVCLSTNCDLYKKYRKLILEFVDAAGIPVDGSSENIHDLLKGKGNFASVMYALKDIYENSNIRFRIGTVITTQNYFDLKNIELILSKFEDKIVYWKLYEYIIYSLKSQSKSLTVEKSIYLNYIHNLGEYFPKHKIIFDTLEKRHCSYFLIKPNGDVFLPFLNKAPSDEYIVGNLLTDGPEDVVNNWKEHVDHKEYAKPYRCIFRSDEELKCRFLGCEGT
ncbi:radical SAM protein [Candidatus Desulfofervidus auxilii]|uniref:Radical SAM protein n=1 Tax=Desulfofervidus auxilii TaxID=1621989 RepID=A0A7U4QK62_DESA2|nr:radical SAM protein [Candidatus Desulfofervidus auxilii]AMM40843.1 radical SAM protein [Candidatus Desulfofervidus auxilii]CAD7774868.1 Putative mycofactocin radical SAM maturase MftC [Candidatus Methanoperedenaceae archaeon GB50]CAD7776370.1 Putative mycofactocin radical SAM maturase MftC [Candidatus Methanoperedenaceae archaeon GB37]